MGCVERAVVLVALATVAIYWGVDAGCLPEGEFRMLEFKCERVIITSRFCKLSDPMDPCFNRYRYNNFTLGFHEPPIVMAGVESWDVDKGANSRLDIDVVDVTTKYATIRVLTWMDSHSYSVRIALLACGMTS